MSLPFTMDIINSCHNRFDHSSGISLCVTAFFLNLVKQLLALIKGFHDNPVVRTVALIYFLLEEIVRFHDVVVY